MVSSQQWAANITITSTDIDFLINLLLERETPMSSRELALALLEQKLAQEAAILREVYENTLIYNPTQHYEIGQKVVFPALQYSTATVQDTRPGNNPSYGEFTVMSVLFDQDRSKREFAIGLAEHKLANDTDTVVPIPGENEFNAEEALAANEEDIISELEQQLVESRSLAYVARKWFPKDLLLELNEGYLNLAEAVLDMAGNVPLTTEQVLEGMGGLGDAPLALQIFSMNYALKDDERFDEVGAAGQVVWYLTRQEPPEVRQTPHPLRYTPIEYDRMSLTPDMQQLELEIADELSTHLKPSSEKLTEATITLTYPHRRAGTLPLNIHTKQIFPTARRAPRIYVTLVDGRDGEEYVGWVVHRENYVFGLTPFYTKHKIPIGGYVRVKAGSEPGKIIIDFPWHRAHSEYIRLIVPKNDQLAFEDHKRSIVCEFDDLMVIGVDDITGLDAVIQQTVQQRKNIAALLKMLLPALGKLTPQGTAHVRTLYSAINVLRRCPPGPLMAILNANPDFENVGGHYWRLVGS